MSLNAEKQKVWIALGFGLFALVLALSFLVRTKPFLGAFIHDRITAEAAQRNVDLEIQTIEPHGIYGLRLIGVAARVPIPRRGHAIELQVARIDVVPELGALLGGELRLDALALHDGALALVPYREPEPEKKTKASGGGGSTRTPSSRGSSSIVGEGVDLEIHDLHVFVDAALKTRRAFKLKRANIAVDSKLLPIDASGYGSLPDRITFALSTEQSRGKAHFRVVPQEPTHLEDWVAMNIPLAIEVAAFDVCVHCDSGVFSVEGVRVHAPGWRKDIMLTTPSAGVVRDGPRLVFSSDEMEILREGESEFAARVTSSEFVFDPRERLLEGKLKIAEESGGTASVDWEIGTQTVELDIWADAFDLNPAWKSLGFDLPLTPGRVAGTVGVEWNRTVGLGEIEVAAEFRKLGVDVDRFSSEPLVFQSLGVKTHVLVDVPGRVVSLSRGQLELGSTRPIEFSAYLIDAGAGVAFEGRIAGEKLNALTFRDGLPKSMTTIVEGAILDGEFGFELEVDGHSEFPRELSLEGELEGEVRVLEDSPNADVRSLATAGPPAKLDQAELEFWRSYGQLPPIVPQVLLSAEDAAFFGHPGFDWDGFRAAMIHNLESGALERGGSTISQQVVKNLFLKSDRTVARKLQEAYLTWRMEQVVSKQRILEIYLNIVEWGGGARGIARAADRYFDTEARDLVVPEIAMLAAILPNPHRFGSKIKAGKLPSSRMHKIGRILKNLSFLGHISILEYRRWLKASLMGKLGRLELEICDDDGSTEAPKCW